MNKMEDNWIVIYTESELYLAEMAQQILQNNGIEAVVINKKDSAYPAIGHIEVLVEAVNEPAARKFIKEFRT